MWTLRRFFWNWLLLQRFKANKPRRAPLPTDDDRKLGTKALGDRYPGIPIPNVQVADHVPPDELLRFKLWFTGVQADLGKVFHQNQPNLPPVGPDLDEELTRAYPARRRTLFPGPVRPKEYDGSVDLGYLAVAGPYACLLEPAPESGYQWDLRHLDGYEVHDGLRPLGVRVLFRVDEAARRLVPVEIDCDLGTCRPGEAGWEAAQRIALCAGTNFLSLIRHFNNIHLVAVAQFAVATRNHLAADHPVRRLLWPHVWGTQYTNEAVTEGLMMKAGDFEGVFAFTHQGMCRLFQDWYDRYDIRVMDPRADAERQGIVGGGFDVPALENRLAHLDVMTVHVCRYLAVYYGSDEAIRNDAGINAWVADLERRVPGGIRPLGDPLTVDGLVRLLAAYIYVGTVDHEVLGTALWNYQLWTDVQPVRVYENGQRQPVDVYQRLVNYNFILNIRRAQLVQDFSYLALDPDGAACFRTFHAELQALQARLDQEEHAYWKMYPNILESRMNG
ncbi:MAG: arachidonate 15-lipoxygenase [Actinomycetota bacterium]|nr:arachidonate 15-lipoxygenase [Actinomycetota bacterium]